MYDIYIFCATVLLRLEITAELGRALAVVMVTLQVNANSQFSGSASKKKLLGR